MNGYTPESFKISLKSLGFTSDEISVLSYLFHEKQALLEEISKNIALSHEKVGNALYNLERKQLVTKLNDQFEVCSEQDFLEWIDSEKLNQSKKFDDAKNEVFSFLADIEEKSWEPEVTYYEGEKQVIRLYEEMLDSNENVYSWTNIKAWHDFLGKEVTDRIAHMRTEKRIQLHLIEPQEAKELLLSQEKRNRKVKIVKDLPIKGEIRICKDKVAVIAFDGQKPVGFVFQGELMTSLFKSIFKSFWNSIEGEELSC